MVENPMTVLAVVAGFVVVALAAKQIGTFTARAKLPLITGFLLTGVVVGPFVLNMIPPTVVTKLRFLDETALAFIAFAAGSELVVRQIKSRLKAIRYTTIGLVTSTFSIGSSAFYLISQLIPFTRNMPPTHRIAVSLLAGAILVARSPSSAIAVVNELRAKGPFTKTALGVTVIMDVVVITLFSICASIAGTLLAEGSFDLRFMLVLILELALSVMGGILLSQILNLILSRHWPRAVKCGLILASGLLVFVSSSALRKFTQTHTAVAILVEPMLICMLAAFWTANYSPYRTVFLKVLHDIAPTVYVAFFTLTGISLRLDVLIQCWAIALVIFGVRLAAIFLGAMAGGAMADEPLQNNRIAWMCYITQAGVSLGLAKQVSVEFPAWGEMFAAIMIAVIVLNQIVGPPLFKWALHLAKEAHPRVEGHAHDGLRDAVIFGLEGESLALARLLQSNGWEVKIITPQVKYVQARAADSDIEIHAIAELDLATLNRLGVAQADSIVAMLTDEENYKVCVLVYENFGIRNFIVRLNQRTYFKRFHELGALVVEPSTAIVNLLDQFVRSPSAARLLLGLEKGRDIIEFELCNADLQGLTIRDLHLPLDLHILSIRRNEDLIVSVGFAQLHLGDWLTVVGSRPSLEQMMLQFGEDRQQALVQMVGRATSSQISSRTLNKEVADIIHTRNKGNQDRFERLIETSSFLDLDTAMTYGLFFEKVAQALAAAVNLPAEHLLHLLLEREHESSTALRPDLAIPHIIIEGHNTLHILMARCAQGLYFSDLAPKVRAVFVLAGTRDQRDYHLYVLSAIAKMVQQPNFQEKWLKAKNETILRNIAKATQRED